MSRPDEPHSDPSPILEATGLVRVFGAVRAVDGISFALAPGELLAVFGPNGAGKSSLLRLLGGGLRPDEGSVRLRGAPLSFGDRGWQQSIGVLSHKSFLYGHLTAAENLRFYGTLYGLDDLDARVPQRLAAVGLSDRAHSRVRTFSRGMTQRLALARALLHDPEVVLLDEPYTGLDAHAAEVLNGVLGSLKDGRRAVVLVTHALARGLALADRIAVQVRGRFAFLGPRAAIPEGGVETFYRATVGQVT